MELTIIDRGILKIDDAVITYRNFSGKGSQYNREGDRNFSLIIRDPEIAEMLQREGWNVKIKPARDRNGNILQDEAPFMRLDVKVKFNDRGPNIYLESGNSYHKLTEDTIGRLDRIDIRTCDMDIRPFDWEINGKRGRTAYLQSMRVVQDVDRFADRYSNDEEDDY